MNTTRRGFLGSAAANAAALTILPGSAFAHLPSDLNPARDSDDWSVAWANKLTGKHKALFDMTEPESGFGVWRAAAWNKQYRDVMKAAPADLSTVLILRHNAVILAMQQAFWDKYGIGAMYKVGHPMTQVITAKNPALMDGSDGLPAPFDDIGLQRQIGRGAIALACNLALQDLVDVIAKADGISKEAAYPKAVGYLVPGVILQPSGVFAVVRAQQAGAAYVKAS